MEGAEGYSAAAAAEEEEEEVEVVDEAPANTELVSPTIGNRIKGMFHVTRRSNEAGETFNEGCKRE